MIYFLKTGGRYKWVDNWLLSYTTWGRDEPKNNYGCVYMDVDTKWKTAPCTNTYYSLCKRSPGQTILLLVLLHDILHVSKSYGWLSMQSFSDVAPTEPPQLPGNCPEPKKQKSWIPFRGHCYSFHSAVTDKWAHASVECLKMGMS